MKLTNAVVFGLTEEELKRLNEALADDNSYSAVSFDYKSSDKTADESSTADGKFTQGLFVCILFSEYFVSLSELFNFRLFISDKPKSKLT